MKLELLNNNRIGQITHQDHPKAHPTVWAKIMEKVYDTCSEQISQDTTSLLNMLDNTGIRSHHFINIKQHR